MTLKTFGRYRIVDELGRGGMAIVYHAFDPRFNRDVALKILPRQPQFDQTLLHSRFELEAKAIAALEHPAIVPVYDIGEHEGQPFLVMRYLSGGSLAQRIKRGPLLLEETSRILERVAGALDCAHGEGIVHRDVKPANILFDQDSNAYLADFGVVKLTESTAQLTGSGMVGTPAYMAPEMAQPNSVTPLTDVYALCVTLYQMVSGQLPYQAETPMGQLAAHITEPIPDVREIRPDLPGAVQMVIERGMAKDPQGRYQGAGELAAAFQEARKMSPPSLAVTPNDMPTMDGVERPPTSPSPVPPVQLPTPSEARRSSLPWAWIGGIGVVVVGIIALIIFLGGGAEPPAVPEPTQMEMIIAEEETVEPTDEPTTVPIDQPTLIPPTLTATPTPEPTLPLSLALAETGVSSNDEWEPYLQEFEGVPMALVPAGCFMMGSEDGESNESPVHKVCFDKPFWIDVYEVTNGQYGSASEDCLGFSSESSQPRTCINWFDASTYCEGRGARLPTEAEWEYAARGPDGLVFPWGNEFWGDYVVYTANDPGVTVEVGSRSEGVSWIRAYDLSGNMAEWVSDWYGEDYYVGSPTENPQGPASGESHVLRGGSWVSDVFDLRAAHRKPFYPDATSYYIGFRCARSYGD